MNHYQKLAIVIIKVIGSCVAIYALVAMAYAFVNAILNRESFSAYFLPGFFYMVVGIVLFALSRPLAALIAKRLQD